MKRNMKERCNNYCFSRSYFPLWQLKKFLFQGPFDLSNSEMFQTEYTKNIVFHFFVSIQSQRPTPGRGEEGTFYLLSSKLVN